MWFKVFAETVYIAFVDPALATGEERKVMTDPSALYICRESLI